MKKAGALVVDELARLATPLNSQEEIEQVATISAQDATVGKIIASGLPDEIQNNKEVITAYLGE